MAGRQEKKKQITEYRHKQILDAALDVFSRKGYGEATIPEIAREAGIAVGTIYNYYNSKRDLLVSIVNTFVITQPFRELLKQAGQENERKFVRSVIKNRLDWGFENMDKFLFVFTEILRDPELREQFSEKILSPVLQFPEKYIGAKIAGGDFRPLNHRLIVRAMVGMVIGFILLHKLEGERSPAQGLPPSKLAAELSNFVIQGLQKKDS